MKKSESSNVSKMGGLLGVPEGHAITNAALKLSLLPLSHLLTLVKNRGFGVQN